MQGGGPAQICFGVFVSAIHTGLRWQATETLKSLEHVFGSSFKQSATSSSEKGVTTEHCWIFKIFLVCGQVISNVCSGMTRNSEHLNTAVEKRNLVSITNGDRLEGNAITVFSGCYHGCVRPVPKQLKGATNVISMVMGLKYCCE